jgi:hypothetical protein
MTPTSSPGPEPGRPRPGPASACEVAGRNPRPSRTSTRPNPNSNCRVQRVAGDYYGGGGNCTFGPVYVTVCPKYGYDTALSGWPEMGREAEALRELVASWDSLTPSVRAAIIDVIR